MTSSNVYLLEQGLNLINQLSDDLYSRVPSTISSAAVGGHLRHCLDFYDNFLKGISLGKVDYDLRERNELIQRDRAAAGLKICEAIARLQRLPADNENQDLLVKLEGEQAGDFSSWSHSSIRRELQFLLSHTVHHFALIATLLRAQGFQPSPEFGIAPSTLKYWQAKA